MSVQELINSLFKGSSIKNELKLECYHCKAKIQRKNLQSGIDCGNFKTLPINSELVIFHDDCLKRHYYNQTARSEKEPYGSHRCFYCESKIASYNLDRCLDERSVIRFEIEGVGRLFHKKCFKRYKLENLYKFECDE